MNQYTQTGINNATQMNLTPADVRLLNYQAVASLCGITVAGAANRYVLAEIGGRVYSSGQITWSA